MARLSWIFVLIFSIARVSIAGDRMIPIPGGAYTPIFTPSEADPKGLFSLRQNEKRPAKEIVVPKFYISKTAVTNADFLAFTKKNNQWKRSRVKSIFADKGYLRHWKSSEEIGNRIRSQMPVVNVSWFAANAYCESIGARLPTTDEWEYLASQDDPAKREELTLNWYAKPAAEPEPDGPAFTGKFGVQDMYGKIWEWTLDFNSSMVTGESREDTGLSRSMFCGAGSIGASKPNEYATFMRFAFRTSLKGHYTLSSLGFRCAKDGEVP
jgi:formylglycine-generating enzyme